MQDSFYVNGLYVEHVKPYGDAPRRRPIVLVHGASHGAWCWEGWMAALPTLGWEAYALSLRNHPGSRTIYWPDYLTRLRVDDYVDDVEAVVNHIGGLQPIVIGHSMGGVVTQALAARRGRNNRPLGAMVLLAAAGPGALGPMRNAELPTDKAYWLAEDEARQRYFHSAPEAVIKRALARLVPESPSVMNHYSLLPGVQVKAEEIRCPVLCISAENDGTAVPRDRRLADFYGAEYVLCKDTGHDVMLEAKAETVLKHILEWADKNARA